MSLTEPVALDVDAPSRSSRVTLGEGCAVPALPELGGLPGVRGGLLRIVKPPTIAVMRRWWRIRTHDIDQVPAAGPVILASNHIAVLDGPLLVGASPRHTFALAKQELFGGVVGRLLTWGGQIPVQREVADLFAIRRCLQVLSAGHALGIFPEGVRGHGDFARIRPGAVYLAMVSGAPIVPVTMLGTRQSGQSTRQVPRIGGEIDIVFGAPITVAQRPWPRRTEDVAAETEAVRVQLVERVRAAQELTGTSLPTDAGTPG